MTGRVEQAEMQVLYGAKRRASVVATVIAEYKEERHELKLCRKLIRAERKRMENAAVKMPQNVKNEIGAAYIKLDGIASGLIERHDKERRAQYGEQLDDYIMQLDGELTGLGVSLGLGKAVDAVAGFAEKVKGGFAKVGEFVGKVKKTAADEPK